MTQRFEVTTSSSAVLFEAVYEKVIAFGHLFHLSYIPVLSLVSRE